MLVMWHAHARAGSDSFWLQVFTACAEGPGQMWAPATVACWNRPLTVLSDVVHQLSHLFMVVVVVAVVVLRKRRVCRLHSWTATGMRHTRPLRAGMCVYC